MTRIGITAKIERLEDWKTGDIFFRTPDKMKEAQLVRHLNFPASPEEHPYRRP